MSKCAQAALARKLSLVEKYSRKLKTLKSKEARRKAANRMKIKSNAAIIDEIVIEIRWHRSQVNCERRLGRNDSCLRMND